MPTIVSYKDKTDLREVTMSVHRDSLPRMIATAQFKVSGRRLSSAVICLEEQEKLKGVKLVETNLRNN